MGTNRSRRRILSVLLAGLLVGPRPGPVGAEDEGTTIADASGGDGNVGGRVTPAPPAPPPCRPEPRNQLCAGRCNQVVADGCGGRVRCACNDVQVCAPDGNCCPEARWCAETGVCCTEGTICSPNGIVCCPPLRACILATNPDICCPDNGICFRGVCLASTPPTA